MKRELWTRSISKTYAPPWPCPACKHGTLRLQPSSLKAVETLGSRRAHGDPDWDPDWITYVFTAWLKCTDPRCGQEVAVSGSGGVEPTYDSEEGQSWEDAFTPKSLQPMPDVIELPQKCPEPVSAELRAAFRVIWLDSGSAANHLRSAVERLMDHVGIKAVADGNGRPRPLHQRLLDFRQVEETLGDQLLALKWLGNTASHGSEIKGSEVLDALEIIEHVLQEVVTQRSNRIAKLAAELTARHAPVDPATRTKDVDGAPGA